MNIGKCRTDRGNLQKKKVSQKEHLLIVEIGNVTDYYSANNFPSPFTK